MLKKLSILILGAILTMFIISCGTGDKKEKNTIIVGMELAYPPFETKDLEGNPVGISIDFAKEFGKYIGKNIKITNIAWEGLIPSLQTGKIDMIISSMTITKERQQVVEFSIPYANSLLAVLVNSKTNIKNISDLDKKGITVAVKAGSTGFLYANKHFKKSTIRTFADESAAITEVIQEKANAFIYDQLTIYRNWIKNKKSTKAIFIPFQHTDNWGVAFRKNDKELKAQMDAFIGHFIKNNGFNNLSKKYLLEEKKNFDKLKFKWFFDLEPLKINWEKIND